MLCQKKVHMVTAMVFPVVMYGCESWTIKKDGCWRIDTFELWCSRRLLRVPWIAQRSNQSILKEINPEYSLAELMLKLKLQYFGHLMQSATHWKRPWCWGSDESESDITQSCPTLCDPMNCSTPSFAVFHYLLEVAHIHVHWVNDAIQPSHPLLFPFSSCLQPFPASGSSLMNQLRKIWRR